MKSGHNKFLLTLVSGGVVFVSLTALIFLGYGALKVRVSDSSAEQGTTLQLLVAVDPIAGIAERIGGEKVQVAVLTPPGKDPESFAPTPKQLAAVAASQLFFYGGLPIEERFKSNIKSIAPNAQTIDLRAELELLAEPCSHEETEEREAHEHDEDGVDPHLWTSPANVRVMVATMLAALVEKDPENAEYYQSNAQTFDDELVALQEELAERLEPYAGRSFVVFHPAYGYFAREFHLNQLAIEFEGKAPRPRDLERLIETFKRDSIHTLIVQPEFNRSSAQVVADAVGGELVVHSPLEKDYFANLRALTDAIVAGLENGVSEGIGNDAHDEVADEPELENVEN